MNEANSKLNSSTAGLSFSVTVVIYLLVNVIISAIIKVSGLGEETDAYKYLGYLAAPVALAAGGFATMRYRKQSFGDMVRIKCHYRYYIIAVLMIFGLLFSVSHLSALTLEFLKLLGYTPKAESSYLPSLEGGLIVPALLVIAVFPAIIEEFLFRGVILNNARATMGDIRAIFVVGFCFALFHGSPEQTIYQFICGCVFAFLAVRSGSLLPCVVAHFINNALIIILYACGAFDLNGNLAVSEAVNIALVVIATVAFISSIVWLLSEKKPLNKCRKGGVSLFFVFAAVGIAALGIIWIFSFFNVG